VERLDSLVAGGVAMADLLLLSDAQMRRIELHFPLSHGIARVDDRRVSLLKKGLYPDASDAAVAG
jgi:hypothetical protein